ncbi:hypothetical protein [Lacinutrix sp. MedPE-SW]|uniref:hypothetical protein n=1 Tax=Lacinutrix sp. MedPE-SW TaxID=1860087 RepID=UPI00092161DD|nr:hypothetical protein [Lacinutrix sp. MedPE-SW]OIQ20345.1 MAG: hypothetical protein BM549_10515 [Lacinutrix sp. MedPE-SW]
MAFTITQQDNTVYLEGSLNTSSLKNFITHFSFILNSYKNVTLNIEDLKNIDPATMFAFKEMYKNAILDNTMFFVEGARSEEIYEDFQFMNIA